MLSSSAAAKKGFRTGKISQQEGGCGFHKSVACPNQATGRAIRWGLRTIGGVPKGVFNQVLKSR
jgi:hypothetical protein